MVSCGSISILLFRVCESLPPRMNLLIPVCVYVERRPVLCLRARRDNVKLILQARRR